MKEKIMTETNFAVKTDPKNKFEKHAFQIMFQSLFVCLFVLGFLFSIAIFCISYTYLSSD